VSQRSTIERDPAIREAVDAAIARGATIDAIVAQLQGLGADVSRSAVGRYTKNYAELAKRQRDIRAAASAFANDFGGPDDSQTRLVVQLATSIATRVAMDASTAEEGDERAIATTKQLADFARATKDLASAASIDEQRLARVREEAARRARDEAAEAAEQGARATGASEETIVAVRKRILGLAS
jgi:hypothetical protein